MNTYNHAIFPSIVTETHCELYNYIRDDLIDWIYRYQSTVDSVHLSNRGGWQSPSNFYGIESFSIFKDYIVNNALQSLPQHDKRKFELNNMWININKKGDYNIAHVHPGCDLSGIFYVKAPENCGKLVFNNPHSFDEFHLLDTVSTEFMKKYNYDFIFEFTPQEGLLVLFPASLQHLVEPNQTDEDRISIAFNLNLEPRPLLPLAS